MQSSHLILCCPLLLLPLILLSIWVFSNKATLCIGWPKYWDFSISPFNEYSRLISLRTDRFDLLAVQRTLKSVLRHNSKASVFQCSTFFMFLLSHLYMTTGKTIALITWTFVGKVMSLLFNMLSKVCHSFSSKEQASFNFMAAVTIRSDFGTPQNKICHCFHFSPHQFAMK